MAIGLQINLSGANPNMWKTPNRLYLNADKSAVVPENVASFLLSPAGGEIEDDVCQKYGLGPYAIAEDATEEGTGSEEAETTTDTAGKEEGPQNGSQDGESGESTGNPQAPAQSDAKPRRKR